MTMYVFSKKIISNLSIILSKTLHNSSSFLRIRSTFNNHELTVLKKLAI